MGARKVSFRVEFAVNLSGKKREMYMIVGATNKSMARKLAEEGIPYDITIRCIDPLGKALPVQD